MAKSIISTNSDIADSRPLGNRDSILKVLADDKKAREFGAYNAKIIYSVTGTASTALLIGTKNGNNAVLPIGYGGFPFSIIPKIDPTQRKIVSVGTIFFYYYFTCQLVTATTNGAIPSFDYPLFLLVTMGNVNLANFQIGKFFVDPPNGTSTFLNVNNQVTSEIESFVDWTVPINDRSNWDLTDRTKLTSQNKNLFLSSNSSKISVFAVLDSTNLSSTQKIYWSNDIIYNQRLIPEISLTGLSPAYTPLSSLSQ